MVEADLKNKMSKLHIIGARGFIGRNLLGYFSREKKDDTIGYDLPELNLLNYSSLEKKLNGISSSDSMIITSSITRLVENSLDSNLKNVSMISNLVRFLEKNPVGHITLLSTSDVYGIVKEGTIINEKNDILPEDYYSLSKRSCEVILKNFCFGRKIPLLLLRLSGIYGPEDSGKSTIGRLVNSAVKEKKIVIEDDVRRDFVYVRDLCNLVKVGIEDKKDLTVNIATGNSYRISELADLIKELLPEIEIIKNPVEKKTVRNKEMIYDTGMLRENFPGFTFMSIEDSLLLYIKDFLQKNG
jgi:nucleoside-diphosphate-sugar epimerase